MYAIDEKLKERERDGEPIRVGLIGAGQMGARVVNRQPVDFKATLRAVVRPPGGAGDEDHRAGDTVLQPIGGAPFKAEPLG